MSGNLSGADQSILDRFADGLARILHEERPEALSRPVTVAELYQDIAPYRRMRELAGIEIHADYEHALIRLLAGEGGFAQLDPESAADELGIEAESSDPDLSLYRKFAACDVRLSLTRPTDERPAPRPELEPAPPPEPLRKVAPKIVQPTSASVPEAPPAPASRSAQPTPPEPSLEARATLAETLRALERPAPAPAQKASPSSQSDRVTPRPPTAARCPFCGQGLPTERSVRFCPHCGVDQTAHQCGGCGGDMEPGWRFCIACGAAADS